jgi:hypothetical protein
MANDFIADAILLVGERQSAKSGLAKGRDAGSRKVKACRSNK